MPLIAPGFEFGGIDQNRFFGRSTGAKQQETQQHQSMAEHPSGPTLVKLFESNSPFPARIFSHHSDIFSRTLFSSPYTLSPAGHSAPRRFEIAGTHPPGPSPRCAGENFARLHWRTRDFGIPSWARNGGTACLSVFF